MLAGIAQHLPSLGISGLLFVMWWYERQERGRCALQGLLHSECTAQMSDITDHLLDVIRTNTEALSALREELRSFRTTETEWLSRLSRQLDTLSAA